MYEKRRSSLLDILAESVSCQCLSDLRCLPQSKRQQLVDKLETVHTDDYSLSVWNDALAYLTSASAQASSEIICKMLIDYFQN